MTNAFSWKPGEASSFMSDKHFVHGKNLIRINAHRAGLPDIPPHQQKNINDDKRKPADKNSALRKGTISPTAKPNLKDDHDH